MEPSEKILPEPPKDQSADYERRRLWIGNVDTKITEFALLKLLQKYGSLEKFDFLYNLAGPDKGKPRGYCFATYSTIEEASKAQKALNGKIALSKRLVVKPAEAEREQSQQSSKPFAPTTSSILPSQGSTQSQISAIERQLRKLERTKGTDVDAFLPAERKQTAVNPLSHFLQSANKTEQRPNTKSHSSNYSKGHKPYHKRKT